MSKPAANLKRFKINKQGVREFAILIEQSDPKSREAILESAEQEDARFVSQALRKVVFFEELIYVDEMILAELLAKVSAKVLAFALSGMPKEFTEVILKQIGFRELRKLQEEQTQMSPPPAESFILGARKEILKIARSLEAQNVFIFEVKSCPRFKIRKKTSAAG